MNTPSTSRRILDWFDNGTGLISGLRQCAGRTTRGCPWLDHWWPGTIVFTFLVQVITGLVLWMHYSPSAQSAWESVYYIQYELTGGWFVRGVHHFAGQVLVALAGLYVLQLVLSGAYRHPREFVFWVAVFMLLAGVGIVPDGRSAVVGPEPLLGDADPRQFRDAAARDRSLPVQAGRRRSGVRPFDIDAVLRLARGGLRGRAGGAAGDPRLAGSACAAGGRGDPPAGTGPAGRGGCAGRSNSSCRWRRAWRSWC